MTMGWYKALNTFQKQKLCEALMHHKVRQHLHPGNLCFVEQRTMADFVRENSRSISICTKLINTCGDCGEPVSNYAIMKTESSGWLYWVCIKCSNYKG